MSASHVDKKLASESQEALDQFDTPEDRALVRKIDLRYEGTMLSGPQ
jgi:hypothetical protein